MRYDTAAALLLFTACAFAGDVSGTWSGSPFYMILKQDGSKLTGTGGPGRSEQVPLENGNIDGDRLTFHLGPYQFDLRLVEADEIRGEMHRSGAPLNIYLKRVTQPQTTAGALPEFDVASVKRSPPPSPGFRVSKQFSTGRFTCQNASMRNLIMGAYSVKDYQISGPDWLDSERYDIVATMPPATSPDDAMLMLQRLLVERFKMTVHRSMEERPVYALVVAKGGLKLSEVEWTAAGASNAPGHLDSKSATLESVAILLSRQMDRPVIDSTGQKGHFAIDLRWTPEGRTPRPGEADPAPSIFTALQEQLGLKLEARKAPVETLVIDHAEKEPGGN